MCPGYLSRGHVVPCSTPSLGPVVPEAGMHALCPWLGGLLVKSVGSGCNGPCLPSSQCAFYFPLRVMETSQDERRSGLGSSSSGR